MVRKRRFRHLALALTALIAVGGGYYLFGLSNEPWVDNPGFKAESPLWRMSMALAYTALLYLAATLSIGPIQVLRERSRPINMMLRRDVAIWAGILGVTHMTVGMFVHAFDFAWWSTFLTEWPGPGNWLPLRISRFGLANYLGLLQASVLVMLLLLSNNLALRWLGSRRWKGLQRFSYIAFGSITLHALLYQSVEQRGWIVRLVFLAVILTAIGLQMAGVVAVLRQKRKEDA